LLLTAGDDGDDSDESDDDGGDGDGSHYAAPLVC
jgi:hypothetical protein